MYKPAAKRKWGYYALPILYADQLVGKLDATADRDAGVLRVDAIHRDVAVHQGDDDGGRPRDQGSRPLARPRPPRQGRAEVTGPVPAMGTARLRLENIDAATARAMVDRDRAGRAWHAEFPREDDCDAATMLLPQPDPVFGSEIIVERASGLAVGTIGFFGPPDDTGTVMIGYGLVPSARGLGYATEALRALVAYAFEQPAVRVITADPLQDNTASHRVLEKAGFVRTHSTEDSHWYACHRPAQGIREL